MIIFFNVRIKLEVSYYLLWISFIFKDVCFSCVVCVLLVFIFLDLCSFVWIIRIILIVGYKVICVGLCLLFKFLYEVGDG